MSKIPTILTAQSEKAPIVAQGVLCTLAGVSVFGTIWALGHGTAAKEDVLAAALAPSPPAATFSLPAPPAALSQVRGSMASEALGGQSSPGGSSGSFTPAPFSGPPPSSPPVGRLAVPAGREIKNVQALEDLEAARQVRKLGDNAVALASLRSADLREPDHPEILAEMAMTYEAMGLPAKSKPIWDHIASMGEAGAGDYFLLAQAKMDGGALGAATEAPPAVKLGNCQVARLPAPGGKGELVTVRVPLLGTPGAAIDTNNMVIHVFLYEKVNGERIEKVRANPPAQNWVTQPLTWTEPNGEILDVTYDLSAAHPDEQRDLGNRTFHGYVVKLYYNNKLAGEQAQPPSLLNFSPQSVSPSGLDNALFPK